MLEIHVLSVNFELRNSKKDSNIFKTQSVYQKPSKNKAKIFQTKELPYCICVITFPIGRLGIYFMIKDFRFESKWSLNIKFTIYQFGLYNEKKSESCKKCW